MLKKMLNVLNAKPFEISFNIEWVWSLIYCHLLLLFSVGMGADPSRPLCRKAKDLRKERRFQKEQMRQQTNEVSFTVSAASSAPCQNSQPKTLEDFISESLPDNTSHSLEVRTYWRSWFLFPPTFFLVKTLVWGVDFTNHLQMVLLVYFLLSIILWLANWFY